MSTLKVNNISDSAGANGNAITLASNGSCTAKITNNLSNRNLVINGGMNVNQYGSASSTSTGRKIFDRWMPGWNAGTITQSKETLTSGGAYDAGHRSCLRLTNTSAAGSGTGTYVEVWYKWEAQDIAKSGWNYKSASSYITLSFWLRSSVAQTYSCTLQTRDGTKYFHPFTAVISSANTWTKITKTFAGNSNLQIDDDNEDGLMMWVNPMQGSNFHNNSWNTDGWFAESGNSMFAGTTDTTWGTTAGATWDITGFQLEVGDVATDFEHRSYEEELQRCYRYCQRYDTGGDSYRFLCQGNVDNDGNNLAMLLSFITPFRSKPSSMTPTDTAGDYAVRRDTSKDCTSLPTMGSPSPFTTGITFVSSSHGWTTGQSVKAWFKSSGSYLIFSAEI